ncbi:rho GDP-dissociation inhibitor 3 isoform X2 [Sturnira hondurensis]|uniref:rho GDP-dissociation inhibitor 3 isoform X2 n=1 Tax=Sturnira hondurensis TaxID=192404 RepID=UPI001879E7AD|nr:rho GDP-dissociation inhibitor 3 isoform X2 [Sturnira hondurensis]
MLGLDACELGAQLLELLRLALCARVLLTDTEGGQRPPDEVLDEAVPGYQAPARKSLLEIQQLDPDDESLAKYKRVLLGSLPLAVDPSLPNVQVTRLTLMSEQAPGPMTMDLTGELAALKNQVFVLKEGVDYKVKITFKVNKEIVSGLKCLHHTYRRGLRGKTTFPGSGASTSAKTGRAERPPSLPCPGSCLPTWDPGFLCLCQSLHRNPRTFPSPSVSD